MSAVLRAARSGLRGRRLQATIIGLVLLAATATSTAALGLLANAHGSFDRAFTAQHGADVTAAVATSVASQARVAATARLAQVTAAAGPFTEATVTAQVTQPGVTGSSPVSLRVVGRPSPGGPVDDLTLDEGHWPDSPDQIVMARGTAVFTGYTLTIGSRELTVAGIAESATGTADAWVLPSAIGGLGGGGQAQMLYRFASAGTPQAIDAGIASVRAALPRGTLLGTASYLTIRQAEESSIAPWVPFIIAFGVIALVISVLIVVNVVSGAVLAGTTRIGVLKAVGFTPAQVVTCFVALITAPAAAGCLAGTALGNLLAIPMLKANARVYQVGTLTVPLWVDAVVPLAALTLAVAGAIVPASRAGQMSAVQAITAGRAPRPAHGYLAHRALARLTSVPRPATLGLAAPFSRPGRTLVTWAAITQAQLSLPGLAQRLDATAYGSTLGRSGLALISGGWYSGSAEADVNTLFLTDTGAKVGSAYPLVSGGHRVTVQIVGEVLHPGNSLQMYIGVFKALGMTPRQTLAMIVCSVTATGLVAGIAGVPAGVYLQHSIIPTMLNAANSGYPPSLVTVYTSWQLILLVLPGLVIAVGGALGPAGWAARTRTAFALRTE